MRNFILITFISVTLIGCSIFKKTSVAPVNVSAVALVSSGVPGLTLQDTTSGSRKNTNDKTVNAVFNVTGSASQYCVKSVNETPTKKDSCWKSDSTQTTTVDENKISTRYGWIKDSSEAVSTVVSASITHSAFTEFSGISTLTNLGQGGKHLRVSWDKPTTPDNFDKYNIYIRNTDTYNYAKPNYTITPFTVTSVSLGSLADGTIHCMVVRAANAEFEESNTTEKCAMTLPAITLPSTVTWGDAIFTTINNYYNFSKNNIAKDEIVTVVGKYDDGYTRSEDQNLALGTWLLVPRAVRIKSGEVYFSDYSRVFKINSDGTLALIAGLHGTSYSVDGTPAKSAYFNGIQDFCFDPSGNIFVSDSGNYRIRKIDMAAGTVSTFAGTGTNAYSGDGGAATSADFEALRGIGCDSSGNIYISSGHRIRKITPAGTVSTIIGDGTSGSAAEGAVATASKVSSPWGIAFDSTGNLYFADYGYHRVRKIDTGGLVTTFAGTTIGYSGDGAAATSAKMRYPRGITFDSSDNLYITTGTYLDEPVIRKVSGGNISTIAGSIGGGFSPHDTVATSASLNFPYGIAVASNGEVYFVEVYDMTVRKIALDGKLKMIAGNRMSLLTNYPANETVGAALSARFYNVRGFLLDEKTGEMHVSDASNYRVAKLNTSGVIVPFAGIHFSGGSTGDNGPATEAKLNVPNGLAKDSKGNIYIADYTNNKIRKVDTAGIITTFAGNGTATYAGDGVAATATGFSLPQALTIDSADNVYFNDAANYAIRKVTQAGIISTYVGVGTSGFSGDGGQATAAQISGASICLTFSPSGEFHFFDSANRRVRKVKANGVIETVAGNGEVGFPTAGALATQTVAAGTNGLAFGPDGLLYLYANYLDDAQINVIGKDGKISNVYSMKIGNNGDGGPANSAKVYSSQQLLIDSKGNFYISDNLHGKIRFIKRTWE